MQLKIYQMLNTILLGTILLLLIIFGFSFFYSDFGATENGRMILIGLLFLVNFIIFIGYRYLERNWDRKLILSMLEEGDIVLSKIDNTDVVKVIRDSRGKTYLIHKVYATVYMPDSSTEDLIYYEKFNKEVTEVPTGFVYLTYKSSKPEQHFIIHNDLLAHFPNLQPITTQYEKNIKNLEYLYSYQNDGLVIEKVEDFIRKKNKGEII